MVGDSEGMFMMGYVCTVCEGVWLCVLLPAPADTFHAPTQPVSHIVPAPALVCSLGKH